MKEVRGTVRRGLVPVMSSTHCGFKVARRRATVDDEIRTVYRAQRVFYEAIRDAVMEEQVFVKRLR